MKLVLFLLVALTAACSTYQKDSLPHQTGVSDRDAIDIAKSEIARRKLTLPSGSTVKISKGATIVEVDPEVPIYVVAFYTPGHSKLNPRFQISVNRRTGEIEDFTDSRTLIPAGR
jgi:hypothetical protein